MGLREGGQAGGAVLAIQGGVDITDAATLSAELLDSVAQVACVVGPVFGRTADGQMGCESIEPRRITEMRGLSMAAK
jgi:NH3-dependent NAD+ synthetase